jgi:uncharacterized YccA/Bax inhibitor family protein
VLRFGSYRKAARQAVSLSIAPYGYTLTVWTSGAVLTHARGIPNTGDALLFLVGAVGGFALVGVASFGRLTARVEIDARQPALWAGFHVLSVGVAIGATTAIAHLLEDRGAWAIGGFAATLSYLVLLALQLALATETGLASAPGETQGEASLSERGLREGAEECLIR